MQNIFRHLIKLKCDCYITITQAPTKYVLPNMHIAYRSEKIERLLLKR